MANILVCADGFFRAFSPIALEPYIDGFINALVNTGHNVMPYILADIKSSKKTKNYLYKLKAYHDAVNFKPDFIFAFNNALDERFLQKYDCPIYIVASDTPLFWHKKNLITKYPGRFYVLYFNNDFADDLINNFNIDKKHQLLIPYTTDIVKQEIPQDKDISFIGNFFNFNIPSFYDRVLTQTQTQTQREQIGDILKQMFFDYLSSKKISLQLYDKLKSINPKITITPNKIAEYFCISITNTKRVQLLSGICDLDLHIYTFTPNLYCLDFDYNLWSKCHFDFAYTTADNQKVFNSSKISLNMPHAQVSTGFSWRTCDILASNAMLLSNPSYDLEQLFGKIIPTYQDANELHDKCLYFLKHENERRDIVKECNKIIDKNHRYDNLLSLLKDFMNLPLNNNNPGKIINIRRTQKRQNKYKQRQQND